MGGLAVHSHDRGRSRGVLLEPEPELHVVLEQFGPHRLVDVQHDALADAFGLNSFIIIFIYLFYFIILFYNFITFVLLLVCLFVSAQIARPLWFHGLTPWWQQRRPPA